MDLFLYKGLWRTGLPALLHTDPERTDPERMDHVRTDQHGMQERRDLLRTYKKSVEEGERTSLLHMDHHMDLRHMDLRHMGRRNRGRNPEPDASVVFHVLPFLLAGHKESLYHNHPFLLFLYPLVLCLCLFRLPLYLPLSSRE